MMRQIQQAFQLVYDLFQNWVKNAWLFKTILNCLKIIVRLSWIQVWIQTEPYCFQWGFDVNLVWKLFINSIGIGNALTWDTWQHYILGKGVTDVA